MNALIAEQIFDSFGRCNPLEVKAAVNRESRRWFRFNQPDTSFSTIHARTLSHLANEGQLITNAEEFEVRAKKLKSGLVSDPQFANLAKGVGVPFLLPAVRIDDYGTALEETYLPAVAEAFETALPNYDFVSHSPGSLSGKLSVARESRHSRLLDRARTGDVIGWLYPCLLEYSLPAMREIIAALPENFLLAGGIDTCAALVGSPDLFLRLDGYPPLLWLAALDGEKEGIGYHFEAYGYDLTFNRRAHLGKVAEYWAGALVVVE